MWGSILNFAVAYKLLPNYSTYEGHENPSLGMYIRASTAFFWSWWFIGIFKPALMALDWVWGTKKFDMTHTYTLLAVYEIAEWFLTVLMLSIFRSPLFAMYNTRQIDLAREVMNEFARASKI